MKNSYEVPEALELGPIPNFVLGQKVIDPFGEETELGPGYRLLETDIDENDE